MSEEDKKLQKHLVDEMMKVYETNPDVMIYMQSLMENYEKLEQENKQLKQSLLDIKEYIKKLTIFDGHNYGCFDIYDSSKKELLDIVNKALGDKENE